MSRRNVTASLLLIVAALSTSACGYAAAGEDEGGKPATVEPIEDSDVSRLVLQESASRRIGLETEPVTMAHVDDSLVVRGLVVTPSTDPATSVWVRVPERGGALNKVDRSLPARVLSVAGDAGLVAPASRPPGAGSGLYYRVDGAGNDLRAGQHVRVRLSLRGGGEEKTIPYSAVIYWIDGGTWAYTRDAPLTFVRVPIDVDYVIGNKVAVLKKGPPVGAQVVTVGAEELLGTEFEIEGE